MKKTFLLLALPALLAVSCKKNEASTTLDNVDSSATSSAVAATQKDSVNLSQTMKQGTYRYVAYDGSSTNVTFETTDLGNSITLKSNQLTLSVPQVDSKEHVAIFQDHDILIRAFGDSITIDQGENIIELKKARGQD